MTFSDFRAAQPPADRRRCTWLSVLVVAWGAQAIVTQSLVLREALVLMFGSEFAWGIVLFAWLFGVALGAALGGWVAGSVAGSRHAETGLVLVLLALSAAACTELWLFRGARAWLGVAPGELLPLPRTALAAMLFVSPTSALVGMAFPLACCIKNVGGASPTVTGSEDAGRCPPCLSFGQVYALESAGSLIGGAAFSFWAVEHLSPIQTALICGAVTAAVAATLLGTSRPALPTARAPSDCSRPEDGPDLHGRRGGRALHHAGAGLLAAVAIAAGLVALFAGDTLNWRLVSRRWRNVAPGYELVTEAESRYQNLAIGRRAGQFTLYCDGHVSVDFPDPYTFVPLAHFWLCQHPAPRNVLLLGGGAEGLLAEILRHPIEHIDYVEPDPQQIKLILPFLIDTDRQALGDPRVIVHYLDARYYVKTQHQRFDLVIARLPEPTSAQRARFYTAEFYAELRQAMAARAVLCLTATAAPAELSEPSREYLASIRATLLQQFPHLIIGWGDPAQVLAATAAGLITADPAELAQRYTQRGVKSGLFDPAWFAGATDWLAADKLARRAADLDAAGEVQVSTDLWPSIYVQRLVLWEAQSSGRAPYQPWNGAAPATRTSGVIARLRTIGLGHFAAALAALGLVTLVVCRVRHGARAGWARGVVTLSVGTTGLATMALSILWLFAFQNLYGYVYQRIGWIIALFMGGLVLGCALASRRASAAGTWRRLVAVDVLLAVVALAVPVILPVLAALPSGPQVFALVEWCISLMVVATGLLGGAAFALAGRLQLDATGQAGAAAATVVGADHAGACLGALLCGVVLVPVLGTTATAFLLAGMKLTSGALLVGMTTKFNVFRSPY